MTETRTEATQGLRDGNSLTFSICNGAGADRLNMSPRHAAPPAKKPN